MTGVWAFRNLARHPIRTGLVVLGVAVAAALLLDMTMLSGGMERSFRDMLLARGYQIRLSPKGTLPFDTEATMPGATQVVAELRADLSIAAAGAVLGTPVHLKVGDSLATIVGYGIDPAGQGIYQVQAGADLAPDDTTGLLLNEEIAKQHGWAPGDTVRLFGRLDPQSAIAQVDRLLTVRGVVTWLYDSRGQLSVGANYRTIQRLGRFAETDAASMIMVRVADDDAVEAVAARLAARFPQTQVNSVGAMVTQFRTRLAYFQQLSLILKSISLVVAVLLIATILAITVGERLGEVAVLRAIGVTRSRLVALVVAEAAVVTAAGTAVGIFLGLVTARRLDAILTSFPGLPAAISFFVPDRASLVASALTMAAAGLAAAAYPAWLAANARIGPTLRAEAE